MERVPHSLILRYSKFFFGNLGGFFLLTLNFHSFLAFLAAWASIEIQIEKPCSVPDGNVDGDIST